MAVIPLRLARPGMRLARDVAHGRGVLAAARVELTPSLLLRMLEMGVERLEVEDALAAPAGGWIVRDSLWGPHAGDPWMDSIRQALADYAARRPAEPGEALEDGAAP